MSITDILQKKTNLTYEEAWTAMTFGHKVQLSDWMGYWFMESIPAMETFTGSNAKTVLVFTRDGDILDTPFVERYKDRTDWQITDGKMGYDFALRALKAGKKVAATTWKDQWLQLDKGLGGKRVYNYDKLVEIAEAQHPDMNPTEAINAMLEKFMNGENQVFVEPEFSYVGFSCIIRFRKYPSGEVRTEPYTPSHSDQLSENWIVA